MPQPITLKDAYKRFTLDQDKILPPEETVKRFKEKLRRIDLDILDKTVRIDNGRLDIPVFFSRCGRDAIAVTGTKKQMGKGATPAQAEASAVMELAERFSFFSFCQDARNFIKARRCDLKDPVLPFDMIAKSVHDDSADLAVAAKFFDRLPMRWTWAYNLTREEAVLVPFDWFYAINEFNGPSAGNCSEEALSQGICEIVERHVSSLVSRDRRTVPAIDLDSTTDAAVIAMVQKYRRAGIKLFASDFTLDMGIPSIAVLAYDPSTFPGQSEIVWTAGTTPDPQKALSRALTEVAQLAGDFNTNANYVASGLPKFKTLEDADYIMKASRLIKLGDLPDLSNDNIKVEVQNCIAALKARDLDVITIDTMHAQLQIPAYYTIVPGAHFRERAAGTSVGMFAAKLITSNHAPEQALQELAQIDRELPGKYYVRFYQGSCCLALNDFDRALEHFKRALDLDPATEDVPSIYSYMGVSLKEMGRYREALEVLQAGAALDSDRTDIYNLMGFCHFMLKEHATAIEKFNKVIELDPSSAIDYANIASNYRDLGNNQEAVRFYEIALALDPSIEFARLNLEKLKHSE
jgi:ribosomal protein S12 methylthiotransferase accessory factor